MTRPQALRGLLALAVIGLALASSRGQGVGEVTERESVVVGYLGEARPFLVRIDVRVDGKPYVDVWNDAVEKVFLQVDADKNGFLDKDESARLPPADFLFRIASPFQSNVKAITLKLLDANEDGKVSRDELAKYFRTAGAGPVRLQLGGNAFVRASTFRSVPMDTLDDALFKLLDTDKDSKLSRTELTAAVT